jgi:hypothetical protein
LGLESLIQNVRAPACLQSKLAKAIKKLEKALL